MFITRRTVTPPWPADLAGRLEKLTITSELLRGNPLGDPHDRPLWVYLPPGYQHTGRRFPSVYLLPGYGGTVDSWTQRYGYGRPLIELIDAAFAAGRAPEAVVVCVDGWTRYGGSQYIDSAGTGRYHSYLCEEVVPHIDGRYRTLPGRDHRAILGKSSGGFGALVTSMLRPDLFGGCASHAGDSSYEVVYQPFLREIVRALRPWDGDVLAWWEDFQDRLPDVRPDERILEYVLGVSACFSPGPGGVPQLPVDTRTGELSPDAWQRWLDWDPVRMIPRYAGALRSLHAVWIDAGSKDEFFLDLGAQSLHDALGEAGLPADAMHFGIVDGADHDAIGRRQVDSLCWLTSKLSGRGE
jgi:S-formylglutathione hydrolase FrmB